MSIQAVSIPKSSFDWIRTRRSSRQRSSELALDEASFTKMLVLERKRSDRSGRPFGLLRLELDRSKLNGVSEELVRSVADVVRETDILGWDEQDRVLGVILTEIGSINGSTADVLLNKIGACVGGVMDSAGVRGMRASIDFYPADPEGAETISERTLSFCPDLDGHSCHSCMSVFLKRCLDLVGGLFLLVLLAPVLAAIGLAVKLTSKGEILFRQERVGQHGRTFQFLKFRTMYTDSDPALHEQYIEQFIKKSGNGNGTGADLKNDGIYKLTRDPRVTKLGHFLRKTSLDELPQFWHVVTGDMSLVGPRPPIPYELKRYSVWHRNRLLEAKPGITGLWQVEGRSTTTFDDMVRLDLQYARNWTIKQDISLLLRTPWAVIKGSGAV